MVEQRPFKALVVGSSPTQPKNFVRLRKPAGPLWKPLGGRWSTFDEQFSWWRLLPFVALFWVTLAHLTSLTAVWRTSQYFMTLLTS